MRGSDRRPPWRVRLTGTGERIGIYVGNPDKLWPYGNAIRQELIGKGNPALPP